MVELSFTVERITHAAIAAHHKPGLRVTMITGDNRCTAEAIGRILGIDEIAAEVLPQGVTR